VVQIVVSSLMGLFVSENEFRALLSELRANEFHLPALLAAKDQCLPPDSEEEPEAVCSNRQAVHFHTACHDQKRAVLQWALKR
jgi:hypothetical protein